MEATKAQNIIEHWDEIKSRPQREWYATTKEKEAAKEAAAMKQKMIEEKSGKGVHRMTRKKRRMREAREEMSEIQHEAQESYEETGQRSKRVMTENAMKSSAKTHKKQLDQQKKTKEAMSLFEEDQERKKKKAKTSKKKMTALGNDSLGDSSLFDEEKVAHSKKQSNEGRVAKSSYDFRGYDPDKPTRKHKRKGHNKFKSKSKYKRR